MKAIMAMLLVSMPAAAHAMGGPMMMHRGMMGGCGGRGPAHLAVMGYALLAALGYWVLQHSARETAAYVKKTGAVLGMALIIIGLLGVICGIGGHIKRAMPMHSCNMEVTVQGEGLKDKADISAVRVKVVKMSSQTGKKDK